MTIEHNTAIIAMGDLFECILSLIKPRIMDPNIAPKSKVVEIFAI
jgi:hypothetical protein